MEVALFKAHLQRDNTRPSGQDYSEQIGNHGQRGDWHVVGEGFSRDNPPALVFARQDLAYSHVPGARSYGSG